MSNLHPAVLRNFVFENQSAFIVESFFTTGSFEAAVVLGKPHPGFPAFCMILRLRFWGSVWSPLIEGRPDGPSKSQSQSRTNSMKSGDLIFVA